MDVNSVSAPPYRTQWDASYLRGENCLLHPKEEVVKFLNRFVRKQVGPTSFRDVAPWGGVLRGLDYGCGIGRQTLVLKEFGMDAYGVDCSKTAITNAKALAVHAGHEDMGEKLLVIHNQTVPFADHFFDITISEATLDSMPFARAKEAMVEIARVTKTMAFISVISGIGYAEDGGEFDGEVEVTTAHEQGTVQSYFTWEKIQRLLAVTSFTVHWCRRIVEEGVGTPYRAGRYSIVLRKP